MRIDELEKRATVLKQPGKATARPGTVSIVADECARFTRFAICMRGLIVPKGSKDLWKLSNDIAGTRNEACVEMEGDWLWFIDDDHVFHPTILMRLLDRDVDIVTPLCLRRQQPFGPIPCVDDKHMDLARYGKDDLVEVQHAGSSGMLIKKRVLDAIDPPHFELGNGVSEDVNFCKKAADAGFKIHVDLAVPLGHMSTVVIWPSFDEETSTWVTGLDVADGARLAVLQPGPELENAADPEHG